MSITSNTVNILDHSDQPDITQGQNDDVNVNLRPSQNIPVQEIRSVGVGRINVNNSNQEERACVCQKFRPLSDNRYENEVTLVNDDHIINVCCKCPQARNSYLNQNYRPFRQNRSASEDTLVNVDQFSENSKCFRKRNSYASQDLKVIRPTTSENERSVKVNQADVFSKLYQEQNACTTENLEPSILNVTENGNTLGNFREGAKGNCNRNGEHNRRECKELTKSHHVSDKASSSYEYLDDNKVHQICVETNDYEMDARRDCTIKENYCYAYQRYQTDINNVKEDEIEPLVNDVKLDKIPMESTCSCDCKDKLFCFTLIDDYPNNPCNSELDNNKLSVTEETCDGNVTSNDEYDACNPEFEFDKHQRKNYTNYLHGVHGNSGMDFVHRRHSVIRNVHDAGSDEIVENVPESSSCSWDCYDKFVVRFKWIDDYHDSDSDLEYSTDDEISINEDEIKEDEDGEQEYEEPVTKKPKLDGHEHFGLQREHVSSVSSNSGDCQTPPLRAATVITTPNHTIYQQHMTQQQVQSHQQQQQPQQQQQQQQQHYLILDQRNITTTSVGGGVGGGVPPVQQQHATHHHQHHNSYNSGGSSQDGDTNAAPPSCGIPQRNSEVPILKKDFGPFHFTVEIDEKEDTNKTPSWLMNARNKLYTNINKAVPFHVKLHQWPADEIRYQVRVTAVFSSHQYARAHVKRCLIHASASHQTNTDFPFPEHVVRADHPNADYQKSVTGRLSVVVPLEQPQAGPLGDTMPLLLRFMCLCSCSGGINRRPLAIIFTLEKMANTLELYGRQTVDVRVCACPMRDYRNEEGNMPRQDRRCGRKRGGRVANTNNNNNNSSSSSSSNNNNNNNSSMHMQNSSSGLSSGSRMEVMAIQDDTVAQGAALAGLDEIYTMSVRGRRLYEFLMEMKQSYTRMHPEYYGEGMDDDFRGDVQIEEEQQRCLEEETLSAVQEVVNAEEMLHNNGNNNNSNNDNNANQLPVVRYTTNARHMNGNARIITTTNNNNATIISNGPSHIDNGGGGSLVVAYANSQDVEVMDHEYVLDNSSNSNNSSQNMSRNSSFGTASVALIHSSSNIVNNNSCNSGGGSFQQQQQIQIQSQNQHQQIQNQQQFQQQRDVNNMNNTSVNPSNIQVTQTNLSNISGMVAHHQIIGSMKNPPRTLSGNNQPVLLIYNSGGMDNPLMQTLNARKLLLPKPVHEGQTGAGQQGIITTKGNNNTVISLATQPNNNYNPASMAEAMEESNLNGFVRNVDSGNVSLILKRDTSEMNDSSHNNGPTKQTFKHIPITAVAQNPSRDQRKNLCVAKKMPRLKPIPGKIVSQSSSSGAINVSMPLNQQQVSQVILNTHASGPSQIIYTRNPSSAPQILLPMSQSIVPREVTTVYPNMSVVKCEPHDAYDEDEHHDEQLMDVVSNIHKHQQVRTSDANDSNNANINSGKHNSKIVNKRVGESRKEDDSNCSNNKERQQRGCGNLIAVGAMNGHPDSDEMLAAQVLASSMGSRHLPALCSNGASS